MFDYTKNHGQSGIHGERTSPHPDGQAWPKCCRDAVIGCDKRVDCAFIRNQEYGARLNKKNPVSYVGNGIHGKSSASTPFVCVHRKTEDGYHRICAGWDACFGNKAIASRR